VPRFAALRAAAKLVLLTLSAVACNSASAEDVSGGGLRPALLEVKLNGRSGAEPSLLLADPEGMLYASASTIAAWRLRSPGGATLRVNGEDFYPLEELQGVRFDLVESEQTLSIDAAPTAFQPQTVNMNMADAMPMSRSSNGFYLGYDIFLEQIRGQTNASGAFELGAFTSGGVGTSTFIAQAGSGPERLVRLETVWTIDRPENLTSIRIGDAITSVGPGGAPVRFAGVQYSRNFDTQPGFVTMPLPVATGNAALPSVVDIYVNNLPTGCREVEPGPFELSRVPVPSGGGTVQVVVRDLLGRETITELPYYVSSLLLRRGLHDFSYEAGFIRRDFGRKSNRYGDFMISISHRYGLNDRITGETHVEGTAERQMAGVALTALVLDLGQLGASGSLSHSARGTGFRAAAAFERAGSRMGVGARGEYTSGNYSFVGMTEERAAPRFVLQAFADVALEHGSIGVNLLHREMRDAPSESLASLFGTWRIGDRASLQFYARHSVIGRGQTGFGANLGIALGGRSSAFASFDHERRGSTATVSFQEDAPSGTGSGLRASATFGATRAIEASYIRNMPAASVTAQVGYARGDAGIRLSATGAVGIVGGTRFASRSLGESFASVQVEGFPGTRIYSDNQLVGVTDSDGRLIVPRLRPFEPNVIRLDETDLPIDVQVERTEIPIRPFAGAGLTIRFNARRERGVLMQVRLEDGRVLPAGATVRMTGVEGGFPVASGGEVYVPGLSGTADFSATWDDQACQFRAAVPASDDPQPRLAGLICRSTSSYASR